ncbi:MAG: GntR family transcriptional regulator [Oscillibacter sp.]|nr:GntR family transcriptional regulator [Oscillibacter sp.]
MEIIIRNTTNRPIYDQIAGQLKAGILSGELKPGEALPSIRALAKDLKISVVTTKRAYDELEAAGFLYTVAGKGCFVADRNPERVREGIARDMEARLSDAIRLAKDGGMTYADFRETARILWEEE